MRTVVPTTDGVRISVDVNGDGQPLLVLAGFIGGREEWDPVVPELTARGFRVVLPEHRGHGASTHTRDGRTYTFDRLADDARRVVDHLDLAPCHVLGHSMGGFLALQLAVEHPAIVRSLVLVDCSPVPAGAGSSVVVRALRSLVVRHIGLGRLVRWLGPLLRRSPYPPALVAARERSGPTMVDDLVRRLDGVDPAAIDSLGRELADHRDLRPRLAEVDVVTTVVVGDADTTSLRHGAALLAEGIPGAELHVVPDAGHVPQVDAPAAFLAAIDDHRRRLENER